MPEDPNVQATLEALHRRLDEIAQQQADLNASRALFRGIAWVKLTLSALTAGMVGFFAPIMAVASVVDGPIPSLAWLIATGGAVMALATDVRSQLGLPPVQPNGRIQVPKKGGDS